MKYVVDKIEGDLAVLENIIDGNIISENLKLLNKDKEWLYGNLKSQHINDPKDVLLCILDEYDKIYIQKK